MPEVTVAWSETNTDEDGHKIYRSTSTIDPNSPPSILATVAAGTNTYSDTTVSAGVNYYRVAAYRGSDLAFSAESSITVVPEGDYDLDGSTTITVTPMAHFDASSMTGTLDDNTGWTDGTLMGETSNIWYDRTGQRTIRAATATGTQQAEFNTGQMSGSEPALDFYTRKGLIYNADNTAPDPVHMTDDGGWCYFIVADMDVSRNAPHFTYADDGTYFKIQFYNNTNVYSSSYVAGGGTWTLGESSVAVNLLGNRWIYGTNQAATESKIRYKLAGASFVESTDTTDSFDLMLGIVGNTNTLTLEGHLAEVLFFNETLSDTDVGLVESYLAAKYSI